METPGNEPQEGAEERREDPAAQPEPPAVDPVQGDQGEQAPTDAAPTGGHDPSQPRATSAAPPEDQSGVPDLPDGGNEGVQPPPGEGEGEQPPAEGEVEQS